MASAATITIANAARRLDADATAPNSGGLIKPAVYAIDAAVATPIEGEGAALALALNTAGTMFATPRPIKQKPKIAAAGVAKATANPDPTRIDQSAGDDDGGAAVAAHERVAERPPQKHHQGVGGVSGRRDGRGRPEFALEIERTPVGDRHLRKHREQRDHRERDQTAMRKGKGGPERVLVANADTQAARSPR